MKRIFLALALLFAAACALAQAPPQTCRPTKFDDIRIVRAGTDWGAYWWCPGGGYAWRAVLASSITTAQIAAARAYALGSNPSFIDTPLTIPSIDPSLDAVWVAIAEAAAVDPGRITAPLAIKFVAAGSLALYKVVNGQRVSVVYGRKAVAGATCDTSRVPILVGTTTYYPLLGGAADEVTFCVAAP